MNKFVTLLLVLPLIFSQDLSFPEVKPYVKEEAKVLEKPNLTFDGIRKLGKYSSARWLQIDPMAEKFLSMSPYNGMGNNPIFYTDPNGQEIRGSKKDLDELAKQANDAIRKLGIDNASIKVNETRIYGDDGKLIESYFSLSQIGKGWKQLSSGDLKVSSFKNDKSNNAATKALVGFGDLMGSSTVQNFAYAKQSSDGNYYDATGKATMGGGSNYGGLNPTANEGQGFGVALHEILHGNPNFTGNDVIRSGNIFGNMSNNPGHRNNKPAGGYTGGWKYYGLNRLLGYPRIPTVKVPKRSPWQ